jgi:hypothetical protein
MGRAAEFAASVENDPQQTSRIDAPIHYQCWGWPQSVRVRAIMRFLRRHHATPRFSSPLLVWRGMALAQQLAGKVWGVSIPLREHAPPAQQDRRRLR